MPLLMAAPMNTPLAATIMMVRHDAAREPTADVRKFTASLLTPTERSNTASRKRNIIMPAKNMSISENFVRHKFPTNMLTKYHQNVAFLLPPARQIANKFAFALAYS